MALPRASSSHPLFPSLLQAVFATTDHIHKVIYAIAKYDHERLEPDELDAIISFPKYYNSLRTLHKLWPGLSNNDLMRSYFDTMFNLAEGIEKRILSEIALDETKRGDFAAPLKVTNIQKIFPPEITMKKGHFHIHTDTLATVEEEKSKVSSTKLICQKLRVKRDFIEYDVTRESLRVIAYDKASGSEARGKKQEERYEQNEKSTRAFNFRR